MRWVWLVLAGCGGATMEGEAGSAGEAAKPEAAEQAATPLFEELYAGEAGPGARRLGDRARMRIWLGRVRLDEAQRAAAREGSARVRAEVEAEQARRAARDLREQEVLGPVYARIEQEQQRAEQGGGEITEVQGKILAAELRRAREQLGSDQAERMAHIRAVLGVAEGVLDGLSAAQQEEVGRALFFLRLASGAELAPEFQGTLLGAQWDPESFSSLRRVEPPASPGPTDIGGLWSLDAGASDPMPGLARTQRAIILALALAHPELIPLLEGR